MAKNSSNPINLPDDAREQLGGLQQASRRAHRHKSEHADFAVVDSDLLRNAIAKVTAKGCAIQFGYTKDGGTFVVRIVGDGDPYNDFIRPSESIEAYLEALAYDYSEPG
jgi:hypothetical protein